MEIQTSDIRRLLDKQAFERICAAARHKDGSIYEAALPRITAMVQLAVDDFVGSASWEKAAKAAASTSATDMDAYRVGWETLAFATLRAMEQLLPEMDVVMTATGIGVVSTNDTAPASRERVNALRRQLDREATVAWGEVQRACFALEGWAEAELGSIPALTLFYHPCFLERFAGMDELSAQTWNRAQPTIDDTDEWQRTQIGDALMDDLIRAMATPKPETSDDYRQLIHLLRRHTGAVLRGEGRRTSKSWRYAMSYIENNIEAFPLYETSDNYNLQHHAHYQNKEEDGAFHFVG